MEQPCIRLIAVSITWGRLATDTDPGAPDALYAPGYLLPDGTIIWSPRAGSLRADTPAQLEAAYPGAVVTPIGAEGA